MRIFKTKLFNKWAKNILAEDSLVEAVNKIAAGQYDASLGQKVFKQCVALSNTGKSGSSRIIVAFQKGNSIFLCMVSQKVIGLILQIQKKELFRN